MPAGWFDNPSCCLCWTLITPSDVFRCHAGRPMVPNRQEARSRSPPARLVKMSRLASSLGVWRWVRPMELPLSGQKRRSLARSSCCRKLCRSSSSRKQMMSALTRFSTYQASANLFLGSHLAMLQSDVGMVADFLEVIKHALSRFELIHSKAEQQDTWQCSHHLCKQLS